MLSVQYSSTISKEYTNILTYISKIYQFIYLKEIASDLFENKVVPSCVQSITFISMSKNEEAS